MSHPVPRSRPLRAAVLGGAVPALLLGAAPAQAEAAVATHTVRTGESLYGIARQHGVDLDVLFALNGLDADSVIHPGDVIRLTGVPVGGGPAVAGTTTVQAGEGWWQVAQRVGTTMGALLRLNGATVDTELHPGMVLRSSASSSAVTPTGPTASTYTVQPDDGWWIIARRTGVAASTLQRINGMTAETLLHPGMVLRTSGAAATPVEPTGAPAPSAPAPAGPATSPTPSAPAGTGVAVRHTVVSGDTMWALSRHYEVSIPRIRQLNGLTSLSELRPGQVLLIKDGTEAPDPDVSGLPIGTTFLGRTYPAFLTLAANENYRILQSRSLPTQAEMKEIVRATAVRMGVDPRLALAHAYTESTFRMGVVSPANGVGTMQIDPITAEFASQLVGRELDVLDPQDNVTAGVAYIKYLQQKAGTFDLGIGAYYQGLSGVVNQGPWPDTYTYIAKVKAAMAMF